MDKYIYDYTFKDVLIRIPEDGFPEIIHKGDTEWTRVYTTRIDLDSDRAVKIEEGSCWDLRDVSYDEAMKILEEWGFVHKTSDFKDVFEFQNAFPSKKAREEALKKMTNEEIDRLINTCGTKQGKIYYASFKKPTEKTNGVDESIWQLVEGEERRKYAKTHGMGSLINMYHGLPWNDERSEAVYKICNEKGITWEEYYDFDTTGLIF